MFKLMSGHVSLDVLPSDVMEVERDEFFEALKHIKRVGQHHSMCNTDPAVSRCVSWCSVEISRKVLRKHYERNLERAFALEQQRILEKQNQGEPDEVVERHNEHASACRGRSKGR